MQGRTGPRSGHPDSATNRAPEPTSGPERTAVALAAQRPDLLAAYTAALPGARAAVLGRLWTALSREPVPGVTGRTTDAGRLTVTLADGRRLTGPPPAPYVSPPDRLDLELDGVTVAGPAPLVAALGDGVAPTTGAHRRLADELDDSVANLALARAAQPAPDGGPPTLTRPGRTDADWEQLVVDGHPLHPGCRTRYGMSTADVLAYAPEHRPTVDLELVEVPADRWLTTGSDLPPVLPMHPWQAAHLLDTYPWLRRTGRTRPARPLMSLRTLAPLDDPGHHVKTAVDVQMTSAVRTVSAAAVRNGPPVTALLAGLAARIGGLTVLPETAAGAVLVDGEPCRSLAVVVRRAPAPDPGETVLPLAALAAPSPADGRPLVTEAVTLGYGGDPAGWLTDLARVLLPPLLRMLDLGVALEAHGQNTLVGLRHGRPTRLFYRDVGGIRLSPARLARHGVTAPPVHGDLATDDPAELRDTLLAAAGTVLTEQVAVLSRAYGTDPRTLWSAVAAAAPDDDLLFRPTLPVKATTAMRMAADPLDVVWARVPNPLAEPR
ncbi:IucA/IucC family protein [Polymorphospora sp. NPDC051019]|uniref:IucA/IucC family protein n=1 Tax=Polymorphospora sp. NPDC051019 TaxID=3155725 RepID=UPI0034315D21